MTVVAVSDEFEAEFRRYWPIFNGLSNEDIAQEALIMLWTTKSVDDALRTVETGARKERRRVQAEAKLYYQLTRAFRDAPSTQRKLDFYEAMCVIVDHYCAEDWPEVLLFIELRMAGWPVGKIAERFDIDRHTVTRRWKHAVEQLLASGAFGEITEDAAEEPKPDVRVEVPAEGIGSRRAVSNQAAQVTTSMDWHGIYYGDRR